MYILLKKTKTHNEYLAKTTELFVKLYILKLEFACCSSI